MFIELTRNNRMTMSVRVMDLVTFYAQEQGGTRIMVNSGGGSGFDVLDTYQEVREKVARALPLATEISRNAV